MKRWGAALAAVLLALAGYVRLAPGDLARWDVEIGPGPAEEVARNGYTLRREAGECDLERLDAIARATPRTTGIGDAQAVHRTCTGRAPDGAPERLTWVTRSRVWGFPDYSTAEVADGELRLRGRARFGSSDLGVNRARIERWLAALDASAPPTDG